METVKLVCTGPSPVCRWNIEYGVNCSVSRIDNREVGIRLEDRGN